MDHGVEAPIHSILRRGAQLMSGIIYCTYLTIYKGNKLPPFYIGSTSINKIKKGYKGSVRSRKYKNIWNNELNKNPELFETKIVSTHSSREEAIKKEYEFQILLNVMKSSMYINEAVASPNGYFGRDVAGVNNPMYGKRPNLGKKYSLVTRTKMSLKAKGNKNQKKKHSEETKRKMSETRKGKNSGGENHPMYGKHHSEETKEKIRLGALKRWSKSS